MVCSQAAEDEPATKKQKVDEADLQGGMADLVKAKVTEVSVGNFFFFLNKKDNTFTLIAFSLMYRWNVDSIQYTVLRPFR